ncbi:MAG: flagellar export protein FliJ [Candidatus Raymondbacteria bacterium RifOxyA12_full_50_37]|uniref:Flagellar FliJ protein n=1 Tax=Candidatus Raymondbacteria bacterium RIFOXYD12_FULL_49_13 TaxID=1817890 RepID=A0A1F7EZT8_UNCRA|nr:MAG: flagellar export protein FliJ [Candidatus Raymondbacteria bacterium RifOxyA12_full_50_37]OGJ99908.1 MAG: flagellar export protein FliJ [Candidatus Raymondbacteria bacterium RIFOXYD12_FULL_49_13]OGP40791.1 MAG: flagellar export protein FliJ [Candidatus Raymondbacteria bacterium RIFOXYB2_FULL_49_35]
MKRFTFNLAAVLRIYTIDEDNRKKEFGIAGRALREAQDELERLGTEYDRYQDIELARRAADESVAQMRLYTQYIFDIKRRIESQKRTVIERYRVVEQCRKRLIEATKRRKTIERIKEKRFQEWKKERQRFEMKFLDDVCQQMHIREHTPAAA